LNLIAPNYVTLTCRIQLKDFARKNMHLFFKYIYQLDIQLDALFFFKNIYQNSAYCIALIFSNTIRGENLMFP